ncbi:hypothetical protein [Rhizobium sp. Root482]|uniref:hypothetical protein n=1 Tax=Rhizobium sp. Root482 TaxID=1736543 RepID=UPI0006F37019|nr:hypothetical protein [Rhizobium sp. Root482]KQY11215.1 hypothetical protein ASD31_17655 [Rhizobium sp. Root482]
MADFVAVIRRTVDGLSDNVPEMRAKVYEKARGAVRRQLENMKPRPSDEMIERQMSKLEAAIGEVENDHAEALPALDEPSLESPQSVDLPVVGTVTEVEEPPASAEAEDAHPADDDADDQPAATELEEASDEAPREDHPVSDAPAENEPAEQSQSEEADYPPEAEAVEPEPTADEPLQGEPDVAEDPGSIDPEAEDVDVVVQAEPATEFEAEPSTTEDTNLADERGDDAPEPPHFEQSGEAVADEKPAPPSEWELPEWTDTPPLAVDSEPVSTESDEAVSTADEIPDLSDYEPVETVVPIGAEADDKERHPDEPSHSWAWDDSDPFAQNTSPAAAESSEPAISDWSWPVEKPAEPDSPAQSGTWTDIEDLLTQGGAGAAAGAAAAPSLAQDGATTEDGAMEAPARPVSYRTEPKRSAFNVKRIALAAGLVLVLGGAGYAYWQNQAQVNGWVSGMVASVTSQAPEQTSTDTSAPDDGTTELSTPGTGAQTPAQTDTAAPATKFTQQLQTDGTEIDQGPAAAPAGEAATEEGKSVAAQTEAGKPQESAQATPGTPAADGQGAPAGQSTSEAAVVPAGAQKMFLYEERLGQSAPTAIEGNVVWSVKEESPGADARPEPTIQAQISVPDRGLTAIMTIKRNADRSLPASHVIEIVFSLPENFEGGAIESVQRVAMKRNEQDRGDPLIGVAAKITDDFHMIALNDFPEATATNLELLRNRTWLDIPLTYRNGRRALLTLEKGTTGTEAFTKALQAWSLAAKPNPAVQ